MKKYYVPPNAPPPIPIESYLSKRVQKDSANVESTARPLTFDDYESMRKPPIRTQGDSMTARVNKVVNTPVIKEGMQITDGTCRGAGAGNFAPIPQDYGHVSTDRQIARLPINFNGNPHAVVIDAPAEIFRGMQQPKKAPQVPNNMNAVLSCGNGYAGIKASDLINPNYRQAPPIIYQ
jgi:hypothetical protein